MKTVRPSSDRPVSEPTKLPAILVGSFVIWSADELTSHPPDARRFLAFTSAVAAHVTVDDELTPDELRSTALSLRLTPADIVSVQAPVARFDRSSDGQSIDMVDKAQMAKLTAALREDTMDAYLRTYPE
jgi:hypothetical protein